MNESAIDERLRCRGVALTVEHTFGLSERSDLGPTAGVGFLTSWPDDVAALADLGVDAIRLTFDWARLQPRPQTLAEDWAERYDQLVDAIGALDIRLWATALDQAVPRWFDNEGGLADTEALTRWWPRWMERVAERWGDRVDGWVPFDAMPPAAEQAWADTRGILGGAAGPVGAALAIGDLASTDVRSEALDADLVGVSLSSTADGWDARLGEALREAAEHADGDVVVARCTIADPAAEAADRLRSAVDEALDDGVPLVECFVAPPIADEGDVGLLDGAREPTEAGRVYVGDAP